MFICMQRVCSVSVQQSMSSQINHPAMMWHLSEDKPDGCLLWQARDGGSAWQAAASRDTRLGESPVKPQQPVTATTVGTLNR